MDSERSSLIKLFNAVWCAENMGKDYAEFRDMGADKDTALGYTLNRHPEYKYSMYIAYQVIHPEFELVKD